MFYKQAVVFSRCDAGEYQLLTLLSEPVEVDECPDHCDQQRQTDEPKSYENQAVK